MEAGFATKESDLILQKNVNGYKLFFDDAALPFIFCAIVDSLSVSFFEVLASEVAIPR